jgi:hypothetical protein
MKNLAALTAVLALAAGLAACTSSGSSTATATAKATTTPVSGTETLSGKLTGSAAVSNILVFHPRLTGPVGTTATIRLGTEVPEKYELYTIYTAGLLPTCCQRLPDRALLRCAASLRRPPDRVSFRFALTG